MTDEELIARLRDGCNLQQRDGERAAKRIEQLVATNEALTAKVKLMDDLDAINGEKIEALEAKLAKAVEALEFYTGYDDGPIARATLAAVSETHKIKGESRE